MKKVQTIKKSKFTDSLFIGEEPVWNQKGELSFIRSLNWYSNNKDPKDSKKWAIDYAKSIKSVSYTHLRAHET